MGLVWTSLASIPQNPETEPILGGSWYLETNYTCTYNCTYNHIRALKGLISGL